jgi:hypothetical protein
MYVCGCVWVCVCECVGVGVCVGVCLCGCVVGVGVYVCPCVRPTVLRNLTLKQIDIFFCKVWYMFYANRGYYNATTISVLQENIKL